MSVFYIIHNSMNETTRPKVGSTDIPSLDDVCYLITYSCCMFVNIERCEVVLADVDNRRETQLANFVCNNFIVS